MISVYLLLEIKGVVSPQEKIPTVKGRWGWDLMFSQRNNPYCDLLEICGKYNDYFVKIQLFWELFLIFVEVWLQFGKDCKQTCFSVLTLYYFFRK